MEDGRAVTGERSASTSVRRDGILVLGKVKAVLDAFAGSMERAGPSEVAARLGQNKSSTFRLLASMERIGLLDRNPDGTYELGLRLMELGSQVQARLDLPRIADPVLRQLRQEVDQTSFLTVRRGFEATCIGRVAGTNVDVLSLRLGGALPLYCGAGPRALLAGLSSAELDAYLGQAPFARLTQHTLAGADELRGDIERTRAEGFTLSMEDVTPGVAAIGAAITDAAGDIVAAISVAGLKHMYAGSLEKEIASKVIAAAAEVSAALGAPQRGKPQS